MAPKIQEDTLKKIMAQFNVASEPLPEVNIVYQAAPEDTTIKPPSVKVPEKVTNKPIIHSEPPLPKLNTIKYEKRSNFQNFLGRLHPVIVHFPIALIITAFFIELMFMLTHRRSLDHAVHTMIIMSAITVIPTALFGWWAADSFHTNDITYEILDSHKWKGLSATFSIILTAWLRLKLVKKRRFENARGLTKVYRLFLLASVVLIILTGHLGGTLIYGEDLYSW